jgi:hypothetical protein
MKITATARNLYLPDGRVHAPSETDPTLPKCGTRVPDGAPFRPTLGTISCQKCGPGKRRLDEFESWDCANVVTQVNDEGDSVSINVSLLDMPGVELSLDARIKPEDLDRFIARLMEIKEARGL